MVFKKILAGVVAGALAVGSMAVGAFAAEEVDTSSWKVAVVGFTSSWGGWKSVTSEEGVLELETTVGDVMAANNIESIGELGGIALQVWGVSVGDTVQYEITVGDVLNESGTHTFAYKVDDDGNETEEVNMQIDQYSTPAAWGTYEFAADDVITAKITVDSEEPDNDEDPDTDVDTSSWKVAVVGFTSSWGGWKSVTSEEGVLELETTVGDVMAANNIESIGELGGIALQVWGVSVGDTVQYEITVGDVLNESGTHTFAYKVDDDGNETEEVNMQIDQYSTPAAWGTYEFAADDVITAKITVDSEETGGDEPELEDGDIMIVIDTDKDELSAIIITTSGDYVINGVDVSCDDRLQIDEKDWDPVTETKTPNEYTGAFSGTKVTFIAKDPVASEIKVTVIMWSNDIGDAVGYDLTLDTTKNIDSVLSVKVTGKGDIDEEKTNNWYYLQDADVEYAEDNSGSTGGDNENNPPIDSPVSGGTTGGTSSTTTTTTEESSEPEETTTTAAADTTTQAPAVSDNNGAGTDGNNGAGAGTDGSNGAATDTDGNPTTGVVFAVIPALAAAAGVLISKKRK